MNAKDLRKHATSIVLVALAAGLGAYMLVVERGRPTSDELDARKDNLFPILRREELSEIELERDGVRARIVRRGSPDAGDELYWFVSGAIDETADQIAVERLIQALEFGRRLRKVEPEPDRAASGLDKPRVRVTLHMGKTTYTVAVGAEAKTPRGSAFAELQGEGVFVVSDEFVRGVLEPLDSFRTRMVLPYTSSALDAIVLDGAGGHRRFVRGPWGGFRIDGDKPGPRVDQVVFDRMLNAFASVTAERFVDDAAADAAQASPEQRVVLTLEPKDKASPAAVIELGGACPLPAASSDAGADAAGSSSSNQVVAIRRKPTRLSACVPSTVLEALRAPSSAFADRKLLSLRQDEIEEIVIAQGDRTLDLARAGQGWHLRKPEDRNLGEAEAAGLVDGLLAIEGELVADVDRKAAGLEPPRTTVVVRSHGSGEETQQEQRLEVGAIDSSSAAGSLIALRAQDGVLLRVTSVQARALEPSLTLLRSTALLELSANAVQKVAVDVGGELHQAVSRTTSGYSLDVPGGFDADPALAADLFASLSTLRAERWVMDRDDGSFGLDKPRLEVRFSVRDGDAVKALTLRLGNELPGGTYARWEPDTGVFVLPRSFELALRGLVLDRSSLMVDPSEVRSVHLAAAGRKAVILAQSQEWSGDSDAGLAISGAAAGRIQRALIEMRAERVLHVGGAREHEGFDKPALELVVKRVPGRGPRSADIKLAFGRADAWQDMNVYYARREGLDATFVIAASRVQPLIDAMSGGKAPE